MILVVLVLAGVAVLGAVVVLAMGRGGGLAEVHPDHPPLPWSSGRPVTGTDAALLRLPRGLWGYHIELADEAMMHLAHALTERDSRIAILEQRLGEAQRRLDLAGAQDLADRPRRLGEGEPPDAAADRDDPAPDQPGDPRPELREAAPRHRSSP